MIRKLKIWILWIVTLAMTNGCDDRVTQVSREAANRQAKQNTVMAELHQQVTAGTHELVAADAKARSEIVGVHRDLQSKHARLDTGWSALAAERRQIASERRTESVLAPFVPFLGGTLLVIILLGFCWYPVGNAHPNDSRDFRLEDFLVREIVPDEPPLLGGDKDRHGRGASALRESRPKEQSYADSVHRQQRRRLRELHRQPHGMTVGELSNAKSGRPRPATI
jgi:hypothetical protein